MCSRTLVRCTLMPSSVTDAPRQCSREMVPARFSADLCPHRGGTLLQRLSTRCLRRLPPTCGHTSTYSKRTACLQGGQSQTRAALAALPTTALTVDMTVTTTPTATPPPPPPARMILVTVKTQATSARRRTTTAFHTFRVALQTFRKVSTLSCELHTEHGSILVSAPSMID